MRAALTAATLILGALAALAQNPQQFSAIPDGVHVGNASTKFFVRGVGSNQYYGVAPQPSDTITLVLQKVVMGNTIVTAFARGVPLIWELTGNTVPCDPDFCDGATTALEVVNLSMIAE